MVRQEIKHSNFLAFLLDPLKPHNFGDSFVKSFLAKVAQNSNNPEFSQLSVVLNNYDDLVVDREWRNPEYKHPNLRIDIVAWSRSNKSVFVIENKVDAKEGERQLSNYIGATENFKKFEDYKIHYIYLTKSGEDASTEPWMSISYEDLLFLLESILRKSPSLNSEIQLLLKHYIQLIRRNIVQDEHLISEYQRIYQQYADVLDQIFEHGTTRKFELTSFSEASTRFKEKFSKEIVELVKKPRQYVFLEKSMFDSLKDLEMGNFFGQQKPVLLWFNFRDDNALGLVFEVGPIEEENVDRFQLVTQLQKLFTSSRLIKSKYTRVWSKYFKVSDDANEEEILKIMTKLWDEFRNEIPEIKKIMQSHQGLLK
jgi:hypothetical protein